MKYNNGPTNATTLTAVYNVFITTNSSVARLFSTERVGKGSMQDFLKGDLASQDGMFLSTAESNVLEFTHSYNFGQGKNVDNMITLRTFEPGLEVLKRFFFLFLQEEIGSIKYRKHTLEKLGDKIKSFTTLVELKDTWGMSTKEQSWNEELQALKAKDELEKYAEENAIGQTVYIAYGVGDNLDEWAGPFQTILGGMDYSNNGTEETITYQFATDHVARQFDEPGVLSEDRDFKSIDFIRPTIPVAAFDYDVTKLESSWGDYGKGVKIPGFTPSLHDNIVKLISYYLYNLGIKNHLVVLPNLDLLLAGQVAQAIGVNDWHKLFETKQDLTVPTGGGVDKNIIASENYSQGLASYGGFNYALSQDDYSNYTLKGAQKIFKRLRKLYLSIFSWESNQQGVGAEVAEYLGVDEDYVLTLREKIQLMFTVFKRIGLRVDKAEEQSNDEDPALVNIKTAKAVAQDDVNLVGPIGGEIIEGVVEGLGGPEDVLSKGYNYDVLEYDKLTATDPFAEGKIKADAIISLELPFQHVGDNIANKDGSFYMAPLLDITNSIVQAAGQNYINIGYHWENDTKIVDMLKSKFGSGTFEGYTQFLKTTHAGGSPPPPAYDDNYFIFGDQELIKLFVYGEFANLVNFNKKARLKTTRAFAGIPIEFNTRVGKGKWKSGFFIDPFWNRIQKDLDMVTQSDAAVAYGAEGASEEEIASSEFKDSTKDELSIKLEKSYQVKVKQSYFSKMKNLVKKPYLEMGHFNEYDLDPQYRMNFVRRLPEEFSFLNDTKDQEISSAIKDIFELGPAFFVGNDRHGNVLEYSFDNDQFLFTQFFGNIKELYYNTTTKWSQKLAPPLDGEPSSDTTREALYAILDNISKTGGYYGKAFSKVFSGIGLGVNTGRIANDLSDIIYQESRGIERYSPRGRRSSVVSMVMLFMSLFKHQYRGHITTLPMFGISNMGILGRPALVLLKSAGRVKPYSENYRSTADFYSGLYKILGFRHTISTSQSKSEFIMYKDVEGLLGSGK
tara:strand:+ start:9316 stop:12348 length:3033 start_codon:yes stop_codon:yes gene_type:complete